MKSLISQIFLLLLCSFQLAFSQGSKQTLDEFLKDPGFDHASVGISFIRLDINDLHISYNHNINLIPASTLKILTSMAALEYLGPNYIFTTQVGYTGTWQNDHSLLGDLVIEASGDPSLCSDYIEGPSLDNLCNGIYISLQQSNIECIDGQLILYLPVQMRQPIVDTWQWQDIGNYYAAGAHPFNIIDNSYRLTFNTNKKIQALTDILFVEPNFIPLKFINEVQVGKANSGDQSYIYGGPGQITRTIRGALPQAKKGYTIKGSIPNPGEYFISYLKNYLEERGVNIGHAIIRSSIKEVAPIIIYSINSPSVKDLVKVMNEESVNLFAEALLNEVMRTTGSKSAEEMYARLLRDLGISNHQSNIKDGSGLSARNRISAQTLATALANSLSKSWYPVFKESLAIGGQEGTLKYIFRNMNDIRVIAKSGSMNNVKSYAGFIDKKDKGLYSFAIIINEYGMTQSRLTKKIEKFILDISDI